MSKDFRPGRMVEAAADDPACPCCGRFGTTPGHAHPILGLVCESCDGLLNQPIMPGMNPIAFLEGWGHRAKRPPGSCRRAA